MSRRANPIGFTRRQLLFAVGATSAIGASGGLGTAALLSDREHFDASIFTVGSLDLLIGCASANCVQEGNQVHLALDGIRPGASGAERFTLAQSGNPSWLWMTGSCPSDDLAEVLQATIAFERGCDGPADPLVSGSLRSVLNTLRRGLRLGEACIPPDSESCVVLEWQLPAETEFEEIAGSSLDFELSFHAVQCRHNDGSTPPVTLPPCEEPPEDAGGISNIEIWTCTAEEPECSCTLLGTLEISDAYVDGCPELTTAGISENHIEPGIYDLPIDDDCVDTGIDLRVMETREADGETTAISFELLTDDGIPGPDLCRVVIKSGPGIITYDAADLAPRSHRTEGLLSGPPR